MIKSADYKIRPYCYVFEVTKDWHISGLKKGARVTISNYDTFCTEETGILVDVHVMDSTYITAIGVPMKILKPIKTL